MPVPSATLVVEDEPGVRFFLDRLLTADGHCVVCAGSGEEALKEIEAGDFGLVFVDLTLPGIGGLGVIRLLSQQRPSIPSVVLTADGSAEVAREALLAGASDYLVKPCALEDLREAVETALDPTSRQARRRDLLERLEGLTDRSVRQLRAELSGQRADR